MDEKVNKWLSNKLPFVIYSKPNREVIEGWFQQDEKLYRSRELKQSCFVMAPFYGSESIVFYPEFCSYLSEQFVSDKIYQSESNLLQDTTETKQEHIRLVNKGIEEISSGKIKKIVLSRREELMIDRSVLTQYYRRFLHKYPTAFVYWFYHPYVGMWMGATPEQLIKIKDKTIQTVALAGTMTDSGIPFDEVVWGTKEKDEQKIVTDFITDSLQPFSSNICQTQPFTYKAGSLLHIKTDIEAKLDNSDTVFKVIQALHPTPALCGFPKDKAREFIVANEGYDREFYGGYLGEWRLKDGSASKDSDLFVNLRCMKIVNDKGYLYLGGGINKDSNAEDEYYETVNKSKTVKSIL